MTDDELKDLVANSRVNEVYLLEVKSSSLRRGYYPMTKNDAQF